MERKASRRRWLRRCRPAWPGSRWPAPYWPEVEATARSTATVRPRRSLRRPRSELGQEGGDDGDVSLRTFPFVADAGVVDHPAGVGRDAKRLGARGGEGYGLDLVAVGGERFQALPELLERNGWA